MTELLLCVRQETGKSLGLKVIREERGGLSDGNLICHEIPTLDGLDPRGDNAHCSEQTADGSKEQEFVELSSFVPKAALNIEGDSEVACKIAQTPRLPHLSLHVEHVSR